MSSACPLSNRELERLFPGESEIAGRMRGLDWTTTALGPPEQWPEPLKHAVRLCLTSRFPIVMYWGHERIMLYNDPYIPFLGETKHPFYLGRAGREAWSDMWDTIDPMFESVVRTGEARWSEDFLFFFARHLPREEVYVTYTIGPILLESGAVGGFFCPYTEVTEKVVGARRLETLHKLGVQALEARTIDAVCEDAAKVLAENPYDIPFAAIYLVSGLDLQRALRETDIQIPIIFITAHGDEETRAQALSTGAVAFLDKPFSDEVLLSAVASALQP